MNQRLQDQELVTMAQESPENLAHLLIEISEMLDSNKTRVVELHNKNFFRRVFSNNTREIADVLLTKNQVFNMFLQVLHVGIGVNLTNTVALGQIHEALVKHEEARGESESESLAMAKRFVSQTYATSVALKSHLEQAIDEIKTTRSDDIIQVRERVDALSKMNIASLVVGSMALLGFLGILFF